jgi:hypothetical protein
MRNYETQKIIRQKEINVNKSIDPNSKSPRNDYFKNLLSLNFSKFAKLILEEINLIRTNPYDYYKKLLNWLKNLKRDGENPDKIILSIPNKQIMIIKNSSNFYEVLNLLKRRSSIKPLSMLESLENSARDFFYKLQMSDDGRVTLSNINSSDWDKQVIKFCQTKNEFLKRISKYGTPEGSIGESLDFSTIDHEILVLKLLLDENSQEKVNRTLLLNSKINFIGISSGILPSSNVSLTIIDYCENFIYKKDPISLFKIKKPNDEHKVIPSLEISNNLLLKNNKILNKSSNSIINNPSSASKSRNSIEKCANPQIEEKSMPRNKSFSILRNFTNNVPEKNPCHSSTRSLSISESHQNKNEPINLLPHNITYCHKISNPTTPTYPSTPNSQSKLNNSQLIYTETCKFSNNTHKIENKLNFDNSTPYVKKQFSSHSRTHSLINEREKNELILDEEIESLNVYKQIIKDKFHQNKVLITKTIKYKDGSINESTFKIEN